MASTSKMATDEAQEEEEEELERFDDFTLASSWERFISEIEAVCRQWLADGPKNLLEKGAVHLGFSNNLYRVKSELKYATKNYLMEYYFGRSPSGQYAEWDFDLHDLQLSFGVNEFLVIAPQSASGVVLDAPEASKLLSAIAIALTNCSSLWPAFVPVHDPSRKAFIGIQNMGTVFTRRFEADLIGSQVPVKLMHLEGLYELFVSKFAFSEFDFSMHLFKVHFTMRLTYRTVPHNADDDSVEAGADVTEHSNNIRTKTQWDDDCPWSEWYSAEDPVRGFELISLWAEKIVESSLEMAELENSSPHEAVKWILVPSLTHHFENTVGFASQLRFMVDALNMSFEAQFMEDFVSVESSGADNPKSTTVIPPPSVLDRVLKDIFHEELKLPDFPKGENKNSRAIKGAHFKSLFAQFCLHSLWFGNCNIRAIAVMWIEFVREVRWYWEESQPLPKMPANGVIDLTTCLINQKLHMLAICIEKKRQLNQDYQDSVESEDYASVLDEEEGQVEEDLVHIQEFRENFDGTCDSLYTPEATSNPQVTSSRASSCPENESSANFDSVEHTRRGSAGVVGSMMLLNLRQNMHSPYTQDAPLMTEDMHEERLKAVEAFGNSFSFSAQLERDILTSDMSAFKAANPDAVFEDFIRWHSPGDWEDCVTDQSGAAQGLASEQLKENWPPRGRLSQRMSEHGNRWRKLWDEAPALPASVQKPLFDPNQEGEKILHYLETLRPHQLLEQMVCTTFRASADTLDQTKYGRLRQMLSKIDQLYLTIASALKPLQSSHISDDSETIEDLRRLCTVFGHVEKLLSVAASLHRKFLQAPRLSEEIFSEYYKFHLPKMGTSSMEVDVQKEFDMKQLVSYEERHIVANMFVQPTANQSWRKVLSMGNLLNGHEPVLREIIFSTQETTNVNHYASGTSAVQNQEVETFRMYICGTSNDLQVALSVSSCD